MRKNKIQMICATVALMVASCGQQAFAQRERCESFMENDTLFFDREYQYDRCDTCHESKLLVSSYFLTPRTAANHDATVRSYFAGWPREKYEEYYAEALNYLHYVDSSIVLTRQELGDVPRKWCPLVKREGNYYLSIDNNYPWELTDSVLIIHGMELYMCPLRNFQRVSANEYSYEYEVSKDVWFHVSLMRSSKEKDLWLQAMTMPSDEHFIGYEAFTPMESIGSFDLIDYRSDDHIPEGLCGYEEVNPEDF